MSPEQTAYLRAKKLYGKAAAEAKRRTEEMSKPFWWTTEEGIDEYLALSLKNREETATGQHLSELIKAKVTLSRSYGESQGLLM